MTDLGVCRTMQQQLDHQLAQRFDGMLHRVRVCASRLADRRQLLEPKREFSNNVIRQGRPKAVRLAARAPLAQQSDGADI